MREAEHPVSEQSVSSAQLPQTLLDAIIADLTRDTDAQRSAISVVSMESVTWSSGALGCPEPGVVYTQQLVPGYRVVLEVSGQRVAYHAAAAGHFVKCVGPVVRVPPVEQPAPPPTNPPDR